MPKPSEKALVVHNTVKEISPIPSEKKLKYYRSMSNRRAIAKVHGADTIAIRKTIGVKDSTVQSKYNFNAPISQSAIGDHATVTNNNHGPKQRHITTGLKSYLINSMPQKYMLVIVYYPPGDKEGENYSNEIFNFLVKEGYKNLNQHTSLSIGGPDSVTVAGGYEDYRVTIPAAPYIIHN